jgi:hypothetical protein
MTEVVKALALEWKELDADAKQGFVAQYEAEKTRLAASPELLEGPAKPKRKRAAAAPKGGKGGNGDGDDEAGDDEAAADGADADDAEGEATQPAAGDAPEPAPEPERKPKARKTRVVAEDSDDE